MPDTVLNGLLVEQRADFWHQVIKRAKKQTFFVVTGQQDKIVGFVNGGSERERDPVYTAELYALYLLKEQGHGYGKVLFELMVKRFVEQNHAAMLL